MSKCKANYKLMKGLQPDRDMVDAIRLMLGLDVLYAEEKNYTGRDRYMTTTMKRSIGDGNRKVTG